MIKHKLRVKELLRIISVPLTFLVIYLTMILFWKLFGLPSPEELVSIITGYFDRYGLLVIFLSSLIEGFLLLGQYFPGGFVIFFGVISAGKSIGRAIQVVIVVSTAFFIAYYLNYLVGKYGFYKLFEKFGLKKSIDKAKKKLRKHTFKAILFSYWEPNLASITATAAGILEIPLKKFLLYSRVGITVWNTFWGALVFILGGTALKFTGIRYITVVLLVWIIALVGAHVIKNIKRR
jgi:membrane-associated protein